MLLITCPSCADSYELDPSTLGPAGGSLHCGRCGRTWFVANTAAMLAIEQAYRAEIAEFSRALALPPCYDGCFVELERSDRCRGGTAPSTVAANEGSVEEGSAGSVARNELVPASSIGRSFGPPEEVVIAETINLTAANPTFSWEGRANRGTALAEPRAFRREIPSAQIHGGRRERQRSRWGVSGTATVVPMLIAANLALIGWRVDLVRLFPQTAPLYAAIGLPVNLRGVDFAGLTARAETGDEVPVLTVDGTLANVTQRAVRLPKLRFSLRDHRGQEVYDWAEAPSKTLLAPGESLPFQSRLVSPPERGREIVVAFVSP
jgi:predicted Zn finger-like uncharacterized protein